MGLFHEGDVASAIAAAKAKGKPLLVFILGTDSASAAMERALDGSGSEGGDLRDEAGHAGWVAMRLEEGGTDAANFRALYPAEPAPVAVAVDTTTGAKIGEASLSVDLSVVAANLEVIRQMPLYVLTVFGKGEKANLSKAERNELAGLVKLLVRAWESRK